MRYGMPYKGSKSNIAKWVIDILPAANTFIDLFAGGCAVTHAAMLSGKYQRFVCNDINGMPMIFKEAINGDFDGYASIPDRATFFLSDDAALKLLYSFGNDQKSYLWGSRYEEVKVLAEKMISAPSMHERRMNYMKFMKALNKYIKSVRDGAEEPKRLHELQGLEGLERLQGLERLEGLERLQGLERLEGLERLQVTVSDYRNINLTPDCVAYADPPYRGTGEHYGGFDFEAFDKWLSTTSVPVYVSEYDAPKDCICIAERERTDHMCATKVSKKIERIFVHERFAEKAKELQAMTKVVRNA